MAECSVISWEIYVEGLTLTFLVLIVHRTEYEQKRNNIHRSEVWHETLDSKATTQNFP